MFSKHRSLGLVFFLFLILFIAASVHAKIPKDTLVIGINTGTFITFDPTKVNEKVAQVIIKNMYTNLVRLDGKFKAKPEMAESWSLAEDGKTWTFKLRKSVVFSDGSPLKADEVVYSLKRALLVPTPSSFFTKIIGLTEKSIEKIDDYTVKIVTNGAPPNVVLGILSAEPGSIVNPRVVEAHKGEDFGQSYLLDHSAGAGSYVLKEWKRNIRLVMEVNDKYYGNKPALKRIIFQDVPEATEQFLLLKKGDIDVAWDLIADQANSLKDFPDVYIVTTPGQGNAYLAMNAAWGPFKDYRVRKAIKYAIDYKGLIERVHSGFAIENQSFIPAGYLGYEGRKPFSLDLEKAKALMEEAGYQDGFEVELNTTTIEYRKSTAVVIQENLSKIGIKVNLNVMQGSQLFPKYRKQGLKMVIADWGAGFPDTLNLANSFANYDYGQLAYRVVWKDDYAIDLVKSSTTEVNEDRRAQIYVDLNKYWQRNGPFAILYQPLVYWGVRKEAKNADKAFEGYNAHFDLTMISK